MKGCDIMYKPKKIDISSKPLALLDRYDYGINIFTDPPEVIVSIDVDSDVDVQIADISTEINSCDGMAYVDGRIIKVKRFDLHQTIEGDSVLYLFADLIE